MHQSFQFVKSLLTNRNQNKDLRFFTIFTLLFLLYYKYQSIKKYRSYYKTVPYINFSFIKTNNKKHLPKMCQKSALFIIEHEEKLRFIIDIF